MTRLESADKIESIVGAKRHPTHHLGRAVSAEQRVYILHSEECRAHGIDLRKCEYSVALDYGIDLGIWEDFQDRVVTLAIDVDEGDLVPLITSEDPEPTDLSEACGDGEHECCGFVTCPCTCHEANEQEQKR